MSGSQSPSMTKLPWPDRLYRRLQGGHAVMAQLLVLSILALSACEATPTMNTPHATLSDPMEPLTETFSSEKAVAFIGQPFPASASNIYIAGEAALDTMVIARFDAPHQDVLTYLADLGVTSSLTPGSSSFFSSDTPYREAASWWSPPTAADTSGAFSGVYQQVGSKHYKVVIVDAQNGQATVYLQVYNT